jgi:hypothetical protein
LLFIDYFYCPNKEGKTPHSASQVSNISFADWAILSSVSALWVHTSSVSSDFFCVAPLLVVRREKKRKEVFHTRKRRKRTNILTYQLEETLALDTPLAVVYICAAHNYLLFSCS